MERVRGGARVVLRYLVGLYVIAIIVQIFLAGEGIFGIKAGAKASQSHHAIHSPGIEVLEAQTPGQRLRGGALARTGGSVNGNDHGGSPADRTLMTGESC